MHADTYLTAPFRSLPLLPSSLSLSFLLKYRIYITLLEFYITLTSRSKHITECFYYAIKCRSTYTESTGVSSTGGCSSSDSLGSLFGCSSSDLLGWSPSPSNFFGCSSDFLGCSPLGFLGCPSSDLLGCSPSSDFLGSSSVVEQMSRRTGDN